MGRIHIDTKYTAWDRTTVELPDDMIDTIKEAIKDGTYSYDMISEFDPSVESIDDTTEEMTPTDNGGCATIELYDEDNIFILDNGNEEE